MRVVEMTLLSLAERHVGIKEVVGAKHSPWVLAWNSLIDDTVHDDETAWCSVFAHAMAWTLSLQRPSSKQRRARSWLLVGRPVALNEAVPGFTVVIFKRGTGIQPGPEVIDAVGHVAILRRILPNGRVEVVGGNQANAVTIESFPTSMILGLREL